MSIQLVSAQTLDVKNDHKWHNNEFRVRATGPTVLNLDVTPALSDPNEKVTISLSGVKADKQSDTLTTVKTGPLRFSIENGDISNPIIVKTSKEGSSGISVVSTKHIHIDAKAPEPYEVIPERFPGGSGTLTVLLRDNDLAKSSATQGAFELFREVNVESHGAAKLRILSEGEPKVDQLNRTVTLSYRNLNPGVYSLKVTGLTDVVGNSQSGPKEIPFEIPGGRERGEQVEFPRFLQPGDEPSEFDPGDLVDTRVVRLFYFRDARRVAELINRNVKNLNQVGYDADQQFARQARIKADESVNERRFLETQSVEAARATRAKERELEEARADLQSALSTRNDLIVAENRFNAVLDTERLPGHPRADIDAMINAANTRLLAIETELMNPASTAEQQQLLDEQSDIRSQLAIFRSLQAHKAVLDQEISENDGEITQLQARVDNLPGEIKNTQVAEIDYRERVLKAESTELRAAQEQFRREVAAGLSDLDTFVPGSITSQDPVTQVSISVVGTSRLQLRGPIKGINKIRRMIHQIDTPVGQVKIGIHTVQVNGEHGDRMDFVYERINREISHSRFLVNTSGRLLRRAVQEVATQVAYAVQEGYIPEGCPPEFGGGDGPGMAALDQAPQTTQELRDWRYMYAFFGADFIDELRRMDSELLNTENKMLSLHSMDTISLPGAMAVTALADHPVRQQILIRYQELVASDLPEREVEYVRALTQINHHGKSLKDRVRQAMKIDNKDAQAIYFNANRTYHFPNTITFFNETIPGQGTLNPYQYATIKMAQTLKAQLVAEMEYKNLVLQRSLLEQKQGEKEENLRKAVTEIKGDAARAEELSQSQSRKVREVVEAFGGLIKDALSQVEFQDDEIFIDNLSGLNLKFDLLLQSDDKMRQVCQVLYSERFNANFGKKVASIVFKDIFNYKDPFDTLGVASAYTLFGGEVEKRKGELTQFASDWVESQGVLLVLADKLAEAEKELAKAQDELFSKRLLEQFMDEQEEKSVSLMEALREHTSNVDGYLKRLSIAMEDDVNAQFYEPAFQRIRRVSRTWDVTLSQIETTTVLTNNRMLAKVDPSATFEFDLPRRDILMAEALNGSKALATEYGNLLKDGTFLAGASLVAGQPATGIIGDNAPFRGIPGMEQDVQFGSELQKLIPDPEIYKFETGTGFEIRPVIQPDGNSIVYTFDYMYTTNVREPVRADEKHLGRVKRHFVHTDVQTSSYELREVSRYTVALKASRTDRGVPLFEDLPGVGALFRPLPSDESSLQTNIILASSTIYPTVYDLMGLRWSPFVDQLGSQQLVEEKAAQSTRREEIRNHLLDRVRGEVDRKINFPSYSSKRPKLISPGFLVR